MTEALAPRCCPRHCPLLPVFLLAFLFHVLSASAAVEAPQPRQCAPCTPEKLTLCPPVPSNCPELARQPGCGCCQMCALQLGDACGVYTARCGQGLSCRARPGESRPLHALTRGLGACIRTIDAEGSEDSEASDAKTPAVPENTTPESTEMTQEQLLANYHLVFPPNEERSILWNAISTYENIKSKKISDIKKWKEPCQRELYKVLDRLAKAQQKAGEEIYRFYLPNCNKNGFYHSKQCETSLEGDPGLCWCVYPWSGKKIPGSPEIRGDPGCHQYFNMHN
ncbi:insulin-like growth factor-binding protein 1 [Gracilinanus agilis]|uniref:insulin-like growth factor-binding protein 1 n=1 Tax=Gracilinanus agilis TaxID=191870 RepID=UPI001CFE186A|nr:insulin-like growth factor-binding protein 1 [Gracilinanus agilis]